MRGREGGRGRGRGGRGGGKRGGGGGRGGGGVGGGAKETKSCIPSLHTAHEGVELIQQYI